MATLFLSQGVPMIRSGDELSLTQMGNNNAYCQDNELSWLEWNLDANQMAFFNFIRTVLTLRKEQPLLKRRDFFQGRSIRGSDAKDILWLRPSGKEMTDVFWNAQAMRSLGMRLDGSALDELDENGNPIVGDTLLILMNASHKKTPFVLHPEENDEKWECLMDTANLTACGRVFPSGTPYDLQDRSLAVFILRASS